MPDVMVQFKGVEAKGFEECLKYAVAAEIENISARYLPYNHLIASKKSGGPAKGLARY